MREQSIRCFVLHRKEIENYALTCDNLLRVVQSRQQERLPENQWLSAKKIRRLIERISNQFKHDTSAQVAAQRAKHFQEIRSRIDSSTIMKETAVEFERNWKSIEWRLATISGKDFIAQLSTSLQKNRGFSVTTNMLVDSMRRDEMPNDLTSIIMELDKFYKR
jgi:hypothetical protein